jgi:hypothetical protein
VLPCQGLEHRGLHDPAQQFQAENVLGEKVILNATYSSLIRDVRGADGRGFRGMQDVCGIRKVVG